MAGQVAPAGFHRAEGPLAEIARADRARRLEPASRGDAADDGPDLIPAAQAFAPQGFADIIDRAMGRVVLPTLLELQAALATTRDRIAIDPGIDGALATVIDGVLGDEQAKIGRLAALRDR